MRPPPGRADADSHLWPCPQCGSANGLNARACWNCDATLDVPAEDELPEPISAALTARGMRIPEIPAAEAGGESEGVAVQERLGPSARRRSLFEAAVARMNGDSDDPGDLWNESSDAWPAPVEPMRTAVDAKFAEWSNEEARLATVEAAERAAGQGSVEGASTAEPSADAPSVAEASMDGAGTFEPSAKMAPEGDQEPAANEPTLADASVGDSSADDPSPNGSSPADLGSGGAASADLSTVDAARTDFSTADAGMVDASTTGSESPQSEPTANQEPQAPSFADTPFDATRFAVKSFDTWRSPEEIAEAEARRRDALDPDASLPHADAVEPILADPVAAGDRFDERVGEGDAPTGDRSMTDGRAPPEPSAPDVMGARTDGPALTDVPASLDMRAPPSTVDPADDQGSRRDEPMPPADLAAALEPIDDAMPPRWQSNNRRTESDVPLWPHAIVAESDPPPSSTSIEAASAPAAARAPAAPPTPSFIVASDPPSFVANDPPLTGAPSDAAGAGRANDLPPIPADVPFVAPLPEPTTAKRRAKKSRSREESEIRTFEDSFFAAGSHPPIHSDDDASFDSSRSGLGSTHPPVRGGRDSDAFGPLPSARAERTRDALRDESVGERFSALASTSAQAARRRRRVTIATLCAVLVAIVLGAYPFFGNGVRIDLSSDELRSATSLSTTPVAPSPDATTAPAEGRSAGRTALPTPLTTPSTVTPTPGPPAAPGRVARSEERARPSAQVPTPQAQTPPAQTAQAAPATETRPARVPREVAERLARRQAEATRAAAADAAVTPSADRNRVDADRARAEAARTRPPVERVSAADEAPTEVRANRRRAAADETAADGGGSITCTERILALNLCGPSTRKE